uniref:PPM-type phosphatase domain-containing protein n=1 Tax=Heterorhabditis bacteriophora TaxID=37862 RepID=A0A1I7X777_HETBA
MVSHSFIFDMISKLKNHLFSTYCGDMASEELTANGIRSEGGGDSDGNQKDETRKTLIDHLIEAFDDDEDDSTGYGAAVIRYRSPFLRVPKHDARFDAFNLVVENLINRLAPLWVAYSFAADYVENYTEQLNLESVEYVDGEYNAVDATMWCRHVTNNILEFAKKIIAGKIKVPDRPASWLQYPVAVESDKGRRSKQEDRMVAMPTLSLVFKDVVRTDVGLMAVFDGHGGAECSSYSAAHLPAEFASALNKDPISLENVLKTSLTQLDNRLSVRCEKEHWRSGTTAVVLAMDEKELVFAWVGDSAAYIMSLTGLTKVTKSHVPGDPDEARRVEADGGQLLYIQGELRVNGVLNLTRALGDVAGRPMISPKPDTLVVKRDASQILTILACDGISELYSNKEIFQMIEAFVLENNVEDYYELADFICRSAIEGGSVDNVTCVVTFLRPPKDLWEIFELAESQLFSQQNQNLQPQSNTHVFPDFGGEHYSTFTEYEGRYNYTMISTNGYISFAYFTDDSSTLRLGVDVDWPTQSDPAVIAPYLCKQRIQSGQGIDSKVYYRLEMRKSTGQNHDDREYISGRLHCLGKPSYFRCDDYSEQFLDALQKALQQGVVGASTFRAEAALVVTWKNLRPNIGSEEGLSTYQLIWMTDGLLSYTMINYYKLGYDASDFNGTVQVDLSDLTKQQPSSLATRSSVPHVVRGRYFHRVDDIVRPAGCSNKTGGTCM